MCMFECLCHSSAVVGTAKTVASNLAGVLMTTDHAGQSQNFKGVHFKIKAKDRCDPLLRPALFQPKIGASLWYITANLLSCHHHTLTIHINQRYKPMVFI